MSLLTKTDPLADWDNMPESHARIGYNSYITNGTGSQTNKAVLPDTYQRWEDASGTMTGNFDFATNQTIDYIAIAGHNLFSAGVTQIEFSYSTNGGSTVNFIKSVTPTSDDPIMITFDPIENVDYVRFFIPNDGSTDREIAVVHAGRTLQMYQPIYGGHSPIKLSAKTTYLNAMSETGNFLGRREKKEGIQSNFSWRFLDPTWYRERFQPFVNSAKTKPFFIQWRPDKYPDEVVYGWVPSDISPTNTGGGLDYMSVGFTVVGHR